MGKSIRKSDQYLLPVKPSNVDKGKYDIYPSFRIGEDKIKLGLESLSKFICQEECIIIDGYLGVFYDRIKEGLEIELSKLGKNVKWHEVSNAMKKEEEIDHLIEPFLGADDPIFGARASINLSDYFVKDKLAGLKPDPSS